MANICPVCGEGIGLNDELAYGYAGLGNPKISIHLLCKEEFEKNPQQYGGKVKTIEKIEAQTNLEKEHQEKQQINEENSVHVKSFNMPFLDMVMFMVKWAIASIPAFIILFIIGAIFTTIFGVSLLSIFR